MRGGIGKVFAKDGNLIVQGLYKTNQGPIPFSVELPARGIKDGPVNLNNPKIGRLLASSEPAIRRAVQKTKLEKAAKEIVERTRLGDQVAMALMLRIRQRAEQGCPTASASRKAIVTYIKKHPATQPSLSRIGIERQTNRLRRALAAGFNHGISILSKTTAPLLACVGVVERKKGEIKEAIRKLDGESAAAYQKGLSDWKYAEASHNPMIKLGGAVGFIRALNKTRKGGSIRRISPMAAWELGE